MRASSGTPPPWWPRNSSAPLRTSKSWWPTVSRTSPPPNSTCSKPSARAPRTIITLTWQPDRPNLFAVTEHGAESSANVSARVSPRRSSTSQAACRRTSSACGPGCCDRRGRATTHRRRDRDHPGRRPHPRGRRSGPPHCRHPGPARPTARISIAVVARGLAAYAGLVRQIFPRYDISFPRGGPAFPLADCSVVRAAAMTLPRLQDRATRSAPPRPCSSPTTFRR